MAQTEEDRRLWAARFGTLAGGSLGLILAFAAAYAVDRWLSADPAWPLRIGSAAGMLGGGIAGRRLGRWKDGRLYAVLGAAAGTFIALAAGVLFAAAVR